MSNYVYNQNPYHKYPKMIAYNPDNGLFSYLKDTNIEKLKHYWKYILDYMNQENIPRPSDEEVFKIENEYNSIHLCDRLNLEIQRITGDNSQQFNKFVSIMKADIAYFTNERLFDIKQFEWLKNNPRACYFFSTWILPSGISIDNKTENMISKAFTELKLPLSPVGHDTRYNMIITFFEKGKYLFKANLLNQIKTSWDLITLDFYEPLKWLPDNEENRNWAINYFYKNHQYSYQIRLSVQDEKDFCLSVLFDVLSMSINEKKYFLVQMKKAWHQFQQRKKKEGKKAINIYLSRLDKENLDHLRKRYAKSTEQIISMLIREKTDQLAKQKFR